MSYAAILSDLDGTLVDSTAAVLRTWGRWADRHGLDGEAIVSANHGRPSGETIASLVPHLDVDAEARAFEDAEVADTDGVVALPGAREVLALGPARLAIVTSCSERLARARLGAAGLPVPRVLVGADMVASGKPSPEPFLLAADRLGVDPAECAILEDAPAGVEAGLAAGMTVLAVTTTHDAAALEGAHLIVPGLPALLTRLG